MNFLARFYIRTFFTSHCVITRQLCGFCFRP